jgi:hypothetical protein
MSTNAQIGFYESKDQAQNIDDFDSLIFVYWDGYPTTQSGIPARIFPILKKFDERRGLGDSSYAGAWVLHELMADYVKGLKKRYRESKSGYRDGKDGHSFGISREVQPVQFFYKVYPGGLDILKRDYASERDESYGDDPKFQLVQTIDLTKKFVIPK